MHTHRHTPSSNTITYDKPHAVTHAVYDNGTAAPHAVYDNAPAALTGVYDNAHAAAPCTPTQDASTTHAPPKHHARSCFGRPSRSILDT
jgi:hypothetical protein